MDATPLGWYKKKQTIEACIPSSEFFGPTGQKAKKNVSIQFFRNEKSSHTQRNEISICFSFFFIVNVINCVIVHTYSF